MMKNGRKIEIVKLTIKNSIESKNEAYSPKELKFQTRMFIIKQRQVSRDSSIKSLTMNAKNMKALIFSVTLLNLYVVS